MGFMLGCNYWASNAGAFMWRNWDLDAIEADFKVLKENGVKVLRVFPNWEDFQPVKWLYTCGGDHREIRMTDESFPTNPNYIDETMLERFNAFCELAEKYQLDLIVALITGWMSGRMFTPPLVSECNLHTDPLAILFEIRLVRGIIQGSKHQKAIVAWELGNETNCLSRTKSREAASSWTATITSAIRACDNTRPVMSGMHSLGTENTWTIFDQGENCDVLTTHPYPHFVPHCYRNTPTSMRTLLHPSCETSYYADLGNKPCFVEEIGTLGPMTCNNENAGIFAYNNLLSVWANGGKGFLFWCNSDYVNVDKAPYDWDMMEVKLGIYDDERKPRKSLLAMKRFSEILKKMPYNLPEPEKDAVCILSKEQDSWGVAYASYILAKQNDRTLRFAWCDDKLPDAEVYMLPSMTGFRVILWKEYRTLLEKVKAGASLYISNDTGHLANFEELTGMEPVNSYLVDEVGTIRLDGEEIQFSRSKRYMMEEKGAKVLAYDSCGLPAISEYRYGKGKVFYVNVPLEAMLAEDGYGFDSKRHLIYQRFFADREQIVSTSSTQASVTLHKREGGYTCVAINYGDQPLTDVVCIQNGYAVTKVLHGDISKIDAHDACVFEIEKA